MNSFNHPHIANYSTTVLLSSPAINTNYSTTMDGSSSQHLSSHQSALPSVCVFSGLPLFPLVQQQPPIIPLIKPTANTSIGIKDAINTSSSWIDGIIRDLIHSSSPISIPQLVQNVREIIHPCNPGFAALLESRLRTLTTTTDPDYLTMMTKETSSSVIRNSQYAHFHNTVGHPQFQQGQGSSSALPTGLAVYGGDVDNIAFVNHYNNWGLPQPATNSTVVMPAGHINPVMLTNQIKMHEQSQHQHQDMNIKKLYGWLLVFTFSCFSAMNTMTKHFNFVILVVNFSIFRVLIRKVKLLKLSSNSFPIQRG
ncbi:hypothetical protein POM88_026536 [Heracleum sosnowskyi]|uniref:Uncharacterized protein n=1 Tax=Heracleum sosnowskyi TaxID=360622 RepID=A0AAD8I629_9APIA|nr:hypothetical protein POM88_026536 [Heracleum sosnowskyi]